MIHECPSVCVFSKVVRLFVVQLESFAKLEKMYVFSLTFIPSNYVSIYKQKNEKNKSMPLRHVFHMLVPWTAVYM